MGILDNPLACNWLNGGDEGNRTPDLLSARQALSQLSYIPDVRRFFVEAAKV